MRSSDRVVTMYSYLANMPAFILPHSSNHSSGAEYQSVCALQAEFIFALSDNILRLNDLGRL